MRKTKRMLVFSLVGVLGVSALSLSSSVNANGFMNSTEVIENQVQENFLSSLKVNKVTQIAEAIKEAYGDSYLPNVKLSKSDIKNSFGISSNLYSSAYVEMPMMSAHVDTLVIIKAKDAKSKKKIKKKLVEYRDGLISNTFQYPSNVPKIQASRVYVKGNYVCFFLLGGYIDAVEEESKSESEIIKYYEEKTQIAVDTVKKVLNNKKSAN